MGKKQRRTNDDVINSYVENYRSRVNRGATIREVVEYGVKKGELAVPKPKKTPIEILIQQFTKAQRKQMSYDEVLKQSYNTNICYLQGDEVHWIKNDKADLEKALYNCHFRRNIAVGILAGVERNKRHWNRTRSSDEQMEFEYNLGPDVSWKLNQSNPPKDKRKTGS